MNFTSLTLDYSASFGNGDGSDSLDWDIKLNPAQAAAYEKAVMTRTPLEDVPELDDLYCQAYEEIVKEETECLLECDDEYAMECMGLTEVDQDDLNDLVHSGDKHAIDFFVLQDLSKEELEEWDAYDLDEIPLVKDFAKGFVPHSPYEKGYTLNVNMPEVDSIEIEEDELYEYIRKLFLGGDIETAEKVVEAQEFDFDGCAEKAYEIAKETGCTAYVEKHREDFEDVNQKTGMTSMSFDVEITMSRPYYSTECSYDICLTGEDCNAICNSSSWDELPKDLYSRVRKSIISEIESDLRADGTLDDDESASDRFDIYIIHPNSSDDELDEDEFEETDF